MIGVNFEKYAAENWNIYLKSITDISKSGERGGNKSLVKSAAKQYCFDDVIDDKMEEHDKISSLDGIWFKKNSVYCVEYKSGFRRKITKENYNSKLMVCEYKKAECTECRDLFFDRGEKEVAILLDSLKIKALETYLYLDKNVFPLCEETESPKCLELDIVIDNEDANKSAIDILRGISGTKAHSKNDELKKRVLASMMKFRKRQDANYRDYLYDEINVYTALEYEQMMALINRNSL